MASGMKGWIAVVVSSCALVAVLLLPPRAWVRGWGSGRAATLPEQRRVSALLRETMDLRYRLQRGRWNDSLSALALRSATDGIATGLPEGVPAEARASFDASVRAEVARTGGFRPAAAVGVFLQPQDLGDFHDTEGLPFAGRRMGRSEYFLGARDGSPYCLAVQPVPAPAGPGGYTTGWLLRFTDLGNQPPRRQRLGVCRFVARFGLPGATVQDWFLHGGLQFAILASDTSPGDFLPSPIRRTGVFGIRLVGNAGDLDYQGCLAGRPAACARFIADPERQSPAVRLGSTLVGGTSPNPFDQPWLHLAGDLEAEFGPERFQAFWTSDAADFATAFQSAFGVDPGPWVAAWVVRNFGDAPAGPGPTKKASLGALLFMALASAAAAGLHRRRSVA